MSLYWLGGLHIMKKVWDTQFFSKFIHIFLSVFFPQPTCTCKVLEFHDLPRKRRVHRHQCSCQASIVVLENSVASTWYHFTLFDTIPVILFMKFKKSFKLIEKGALMFYRRPRIKRTSTWYKDFLRRLRTKTTWKIITWEAKFHFASQVIIFHFVLVRS